MSDIDIKVDAAPIRIEISAAQGALGSGGLYGSVEAVPDTLGLRDDDGSTKFGSLKLSGTIDALNVGTIAEKTYAQSEAQPSATYAGDQWLDPATGRKYELLEGVYVEVSAGGPLSAEPAVPDPAYLTPDGGNIRTEDGGLVLTASATDLTPEPDIQDFLAAPDNSAARALLEVQEPDAITRTAAEGLPKESADVAVFLSGDPRYTGGAPLPTDVRLEFVEIGSDGRGDYDGGGWGMSWTDVSGWYVEYNDGAYPAFYNPDDVATPDLCTSPWTNSNSAGSIEVGLSVADGDYIGQLCRVGDDPDYTWYRWNGSIWEEDVEDTHGVEEAPEDGSQYARRDAGWEVIEEPIIENFNVSVARTSLLMTHGVDYGANSINGEYIWDEPGCVYRKDGFHISVEYGTYTCVFRLMSDATQLAHLVAGTAAGEWTALAPIGSIAGITTEYGDVVLQKRLSLTNVSEVVNEAAPNDKITFGPGQYEYNGLPFNGDVESYTGNHRYLSPDIVLASESYRTATLKLVMLDYDIKYLDLTVPMIRGGGKLTLDGLVFDINAYDNITNNPSNWYVENILDPQPGNDVDWVWGEENTDLAPYFRAITIDGGNSVIRGCHFMHWTSGGTNSYYGGTTHAEHAAFVMRGVPILFDDVLITSPVRVDSGSPYCTVIGARNSTTFRNVSVIFPDTVDNFWTLGDQPEFSSSRCFAFGLFDWTVYDGCYARNCSKMFHRDTNPITGLSIENCSCDKVTTAVSLTISFVEQVCRNISIRNNTFNVINSNEGLVSGSGLKVQTPNDVSGLVYENNQITGPDSNCFAAIIQTITFSRIVFRNNVAGVIGEASTNNPPQIEGSMRCIIEERNANGPEWSYNVDPLRYDSEVAAVTNGGTGEVTKEDMIESFGLDNFVPPTSDPGVPGAIWNNGGTIAISS